MDHDACLDGLKTKNNNNPKIDFPVRCQCEFVIVRGMLEARNARELGGDLGELCDAEFYENPLIQKLEFNEEDFLAVPFCALINEYCLREEDLVTNYPDELFYCSALGEGLAAFGL